MASVSVSVSVSVPVFVAAAVCVGVEAASNAMFAYALGAVSVPVYGLPVAIDGALLAAVSVAAAVIQARSATTLLHPAPGENSAVAAALMLACMTYSVGTMTSHVLQLQRHQMEAAADAARKYVSAKQSRDDARAAYDAAAADHNALRAEQAKLGSQRPLAAITTDVTAARVPKSTWTDSKGCTNFPYDGMREPCAPVVALYRERANAERAAALLPLIDAARQAVDARRAALAPLENEYVATRQPAVLGPAEVAIAAGLPWVLAVVLEACGTFGFAASRRASPKVASAPIGSRPSAPTRDPDDAALHKLLHGIAAGTAKVAGCNATSDGWVNAPLRTLGAVLHRAAPTVGRQLDALEAAGAIARRKVGAKVHIRLIAGSPAA